jgi:hypothetical protein
MEAARGGRPRRTDTPAMIDAKWAWSRSNTVDVLLAVATHRCWPGTGSVRFRERSHQKAPTPAAIKRPNATTRHPRVRVVSDRKWAQFACSSAFNSTPIRCRRRISTAPVTELRMNSSPLIPDKLRALTTSPPGSVTLVPAVT